MDQFRKTTALGEDTKEFPGVRDNGQGGLITPISDIHCAPWRDARVDGKDFLFARFGRVLSYVGGSRVIGQVARSSEVETMTSQSCHIAIGGFGRFPALIPPEDPLRNHSPENGAHVTSSEK
ncbi:hypothetical protein CDAR_27281 [Caerostris darwini]|uniref:Uncharacterized protein n=1 Tax=Caerostris darwini TaxID=1538125 RepID=A0AAV4RA93_9ARAC|nr:hypothetical protein CDAR_27281 [Caerostris darwini]